MEKGCREMGVDGEDLEKNPALGQYTFSLSLSLLYKADEDP